MVMKKQVFDVFRDIYYLKLAVLIKLVSRWENGVDQLAHIMGRLRYRYGYVGFKDGKTFFLDVLLKSFPDLSRKQVQSMLEGFWYHHQRFFLELFWFMDLHPGFLEKNVSFVDLKYLDIAREHKKGVVLFVPHMGNERLIHLALAIKNYPIAVITGDFADAGPYVRKVKLQTTRKFNQLFFPYDMPRRYIRFIREQQGILQVSPPAEPVKKETLLDLLNHHIPISTSAFRIAQQAGSPIVPALCVRKGTHRFDLVFGEPLILDNNTAKNHDFNKELKRVYSWIETYVRQYPEQFNWLWLATKVATKKDS
jgi:lauroyl/myristoyl acyltransferase